MDDQELAAIRAARLNQLRQSVPVAEDVGIPANDADEEAKRAQALQQEQMRRDLLATVLDNNARERRALFHLIPWMG